MTLREYLGVIRRSWRAILVAGLVGLAVAVAFIWASPRQYSASVTFYITTTASTPSPTDAYQGSLMSQDRVKSYRQLLSSYRTGVDVVNDLKLSADPADIADEVSTSVTPNTVLLTATVTDGSSSRAQAIAGSLARVFPALVATLEKPPVGNAPPAVFAQVFQGPLLATLASPLPSTYLPIGAVVGLLAGVLVVVLRRHLDVRVRTLRELAAAFPEPVLGTLVNDRAVAKTPLFVRDRPKAAISENLRLVRTNLEIFGFRRGASCYVVTSAVNEEGKSTLVANLALAESTAGRRVLVIEGDLRRPRVARWLGVRSELGLTEVLSGDATFADAVQNGAAPGLSCLTSGSLPRDPYEMVHSPRMAAVLEEARKRHDIVLVDAPPLLPVADGLELARHSDGVLFVVRAGRAPASSIARAHDLLAAAGIDHVAAVLNAASRTEAGGYSGDYASHDAHDSHSAARHARTSDDRPLGPPAAIPAPGSEPSEGLSGAAPHTGQDLR